MRGLLLMMIALLLGGCSCQRQADVEANPVPATQAAPTQLPADAEVAASVSQDASAKNSANLSQAASTLHAYLAVVAGKDWGKADTYWVGGKAPPRPDDYAVRSIEDLGSMRINNQTPEPLDEELPTRAVEIPVTLRLRGKDGIREISGWYRLRRKVGDDGWEITSASMPPSLD
jgi:hypothetical protein